ncbi:MAG: aminopeptidase P N-terminal domain-containing protein [Candidatus Binataceae bacterium]|nr:aminopeptidase P N-terminal domain-containing protein [Candidatus Binataceae bacterium]
MTVDKTTIFKARRKRFAEAIGKGAVAVIPSAPVAVRSRDVEFPYHQDHDFYYLSGFDEPESVIIIAPEHPEGEFAMLVRPRDKDREIWTGRRAGVEGALALFGADKAFTIDELDDVLPRYLRDAERVFYSLGGDERMNARMIQLMRASEANRERYGVGPTALLDPREILHEHRLFKQPEELDAMRRAIAISADAHRRAMATAKGGSGEWEIQALLEYAFRSQGATGPAYPSIVASGANATVLHYIHNDRRMEQGDLLLIDAGSEYDFYASDITRTFPVGTRFNDAQRDLYQLVLEAQLKGIAAVKPGVSFETPHEAAVRTLVEGMRELKLLAGAVDDLISTGAYRQFYMHRTSHWLGMDVHDVGLYRVDGESRKLEPGMVLTIEPGIYIAADDDSAPAQMRGIGIRIEDDVLVTPGGHEVLSAQIPKSVAEIESLTAA